MTFCFLRTNRVRPRCANDRAEVRRIAGQAAPIGAIALVNMGMGVTDTIMGAALGTEALAGVAIASDLYSLVFLLMAGVIGGLAPLYATASARGEADRLASLRGAGWLVVLGCAVLAAPVLVLAPALLSGIGVDSALVAAGRGYAAVMALVFVPNLVVAVYRARLTALERPGLLLRLTLAALPLNALGNWLFVFWIGGGNGLGATGLALSSLVVWSVIALTLVAFAWRTGDAGRRLRVDVHTVVEIARVGVPIGLMTLAEVGLFLGATIYVGTFSAEEAAAHTIVIRLAGVTYAVSIGLNQATMVRAARQESLAGIRTVIASALTLARTAGLGLGAMLAVIAFGAIQAAGAAAGDLAAVAALAVPAIALLALIECAAPIGASADGVLRGRRDTRVAMICSITGNWLIAAPAILVLTQHLSLGLTGLWLGLAAGSLTSVLLMCSRLPRHWHTDFDPLQNGAEQC